MYIYTLGDFVTSVCEIVNYYLKKKFALQKKYFIFYAHYYKGVTKLFNISEKTSCFRFILFSVKIWIVNYIYNNNKLVFVLSSEIYKKQLQQQQF